MPSEVMKRQGVCQQCGTCCRYEIPLTLLDLRSLSRALDLDPAQCFAELVEPEISDTSGLMKLKKREDGLCLLIDDQNRCSIHEAKPRVCRFYVCDKIDPEINSENWTSSCGSVEEQAELWQYSLATSITKAYLQEHGPRFVQSDFERGLSSIEANSPSATRKVKLCRAAEGTPMALVYDCSSCKKHGSQAPETPVTLDDVHRIAKHLELTPAKVFTLFIDPEPSTLTGGLRLRREEHCVFRPASGEHVCGVEAARPMHCRFVACPQRAGELADRFYLGSGTVEEQFRHQLALELTRRYVALHGTGFNKKGYNELLRELQRSRGRRNADFRAFCERLAEYRYIDDTAKAAG